MIQTWQSIVVDLVVKSAILVGVAGLGWLILRRASAAAKHLVLALAVVCLLALPTLSLLVPRWSVPFLKVTAQEPLTAASTASTPVADPADRTARVVAQPEVPLASWLVVLWVGATGLCLAKLGFGLMAVRRTRRACNAYPYGSTRSLAEDLLHQVAPRAVLLNGGNLPPMTWGWQRPVLLLPSEAVEWPEDRVRSVVLHEIAHIERADWLTHLFAQVACAVYWFHPGVWLVARQMTIESERAADDRVLREGVSPAQYAEHLIAQVRSRKRGSRSTGIALAMARPGQITVRLSSILEPQVSRTPIQHHFAVGSTLGAAAIAAVVAAAVPTIERIQSAGELEVPVRTESPASEPAPTRRAEAVSPSAKPTRSSVVPPQPATPSGPARKAENRTPRTAGVTPRRQNQSSDFATASTRPQPVEKVRNPAAPVANSSQRPTPTPAKHQPTAAAKEESVPPTDNKAEMSLQDQVAASVTESSKRQLQATLETVQAHTAAVMDQAARRIRSTGGIPPKEAEDAMRQVEEAKREVARALKEAHEELDSKLAEAFGKLPVGDRERRSSSPPTKKEAPPMKRS